MVVQRTAGLLSVEQPAVFWGDALRGDRQVPARRWHVYDREIHKCRVIQGVYLEAGRQRRAFERPALAVAGTGLAPSAPGTFAPRSFITTFQSDVASTLELQVQLHRVTLGIHKTQVCIVDSSSSEKSQEPTRNRRAGQTGS